MAASLHVAAQIHTTNPQSKNAVMQTLAPLQNDVAAASQRWPSNRLTRLWPQRQRCRRRPTRRRPTRRRLRRRQSPIRRRRRLPKKMRAPTVLLSASRRQRCGTRLHRRRRLPGLPHGQAAGASSRSCASSLMTKRRSQRRSCRDLFKRLKTIETHRYLLSRPAPRLSRRQTWTISWRAPLDAAHCAPQASRRRRSPLQQRWPRWPIPQLAIRTSQSWAQGAAGAATAAAVGAAAVADLRSLLGTVGGGGDDGSGDAGGDAGGQDRARRGELNVAKARRHQHVMLSFGDNFKVTGPYAGRSDGRRGRKRKFGHAVKRTPLRRTDWTSLQLCSCSPHTSKLRASYFAD